MTNATVIIADGLRPVDVGPYGNEWLPTPNLDRLAAQSVVFDQHFADRPSRFAFRARFALSATDQQAAVELPKELRIIEYTHLLPPWSPPDAMLEAAFEDWEFEVKPTPWLDPQPGWIDPDNAVAVDRLRRTHVAAVCQFDDWLGEILDQDADGLLIVTAGRGQSLGETRMFADVRPWLHEEMVPLPLIVRLPQFEQAGRRVGHVTQSIDLTATIFESFNVSRPTDWHGHSLLALCRGGGPIRDYAIMSHSLGGGAEFALQTLEEKVILPIETLSGDPPRKPMFFVKPDDRWDVNDLRQPNLDYAEQLERTLVDFVAASKQPGPLVAPPLPERETDHADCQTG